MQITNNDKTIESSPTFTAYAAIAARLDAQGRSDAAADENPDFFLSTAHQQRIDAVRDIVTSFFTDRKAVYVNHRQNRSRPFTVVKLDDARWPAKITSVAKKNQHLYDPLKRLGNVEIVNSRRTNSWLFRIY